MMSTLWRRSECTENAARRSSADKQLITPTEPRADAAALKGAPAGGRLTESIGIGAESIASPRTCGNLRERSESPRQRGEVNMLMVSTVATDGPGKPGKERSICCNVRRCNDITAVRCGEDKIHGRGRLAATVASCWQWSHHPGAVPPGATRQTLV